MVFSYAVVSSIGMVGFVLLIGSMVERCHGRSNSCGGDSRFLFRFQVRWVIYDLYCSRLVGCMCCIVVMVRLFIESWTK
jgi:hypothetical protein